MSVDWGSIGWWIVDVVAVAILGLLIVFGIMQSRRRRTDLEREGKPPEAANWPTRARREEERARKR